MESRNQEGISSSSVRLREHRFGIATKMGRRCLEKRQKTSSRLFCGYLLYHKITPSSDHAVKPSADCMHIERSDHTPLFSNAATAPPTPVFAATSAEFALFPKYEYKGSRPRRSTQSSEPNVLSLDASERYSQTDLSRLRSDAFWELHQSVADSGERLVRRMRDYEHTRSRSEAHLKAKEAQRRGRKRSSLVSPRKTTTLSQESDDEEIQIFAGEFTGTLFTGNPRFKKRALSLDMDEDSHRGDYSSPVVGSERCSSPGATCDSSSSVDPSDYDDYPVSDTTQPLVENFFSSHTHAHIHPVSSTPPLSHMLSDSANSSLHSLRLPPPLASVPLTPRPTAPSVSRSEKAIAALSLAMANGAGGLNDYEALRTFEGAPALDYCQVGEMWH